jgi:uncharacterized membrane protein YfhO
MAANEVTISVVADVPSIVILTDLMYPGWKVELNNSIIDPVPDGVFRAVPVPAGSHTIRWRYRPASLGIGGGVSAVAIVMSILFYRSRSRPEPMLA